MNIDKYNKLHSKLMEKLEANEITIETVKEVNDLAFEKYITEAGSAKSSLKKIKDTTIKKKLPDWTLCKIRPDDETRDRIEKCYENLKKLDSPIKQAITDYFNKNKKGKESIASYIKFASLTDKYFCVRQRETGKIEIHITRCYATINTKGLNWNPNSSEFIDAVEKVLYKKQGSNVTDDEGISFMYKEGAVCGSVVFSIKEDKKDDKKDDKEKAEPDKEDNKSV